MTVEQLKQVWKADPFRPFRIHLADGRDIAVNHRDFVMSSPSGRTIIVYQPDDSFNVIDLLLVTDLEVSNGKSQRRKKQA
jgi:hypothetical protein